MCEDIPHVGQDMTQNKIFGNGGTFCPSLPFGQFCQSYPPITGFILLFGHQNLGIDTSLLCGDTCNNGQAMIQNIIFGNGGIFYPALPFLGYFDKGTPSRFFAKMFIFVLVPINLIMSGVRPDSIQSPFWKSSHRRSVAILARNICCQCYYLRFTMCI